MYLRCSFREEQLSLPPLFSFCQQSFCHRSHSQRDDPQNEVDRRAMAGGAATPAWQCVLY